MELASVARPPDTSEMIEVSQAGTVERVYRGILRDLEEGRMVPGQRLVETDLATRYAVGRNAVREAMQRLAARGVVDLARNRSPAIRWLDRAETLEVLDVAEAMTALALRSAASRYDRERDSAALQKTMELLLEADRIDEIGAFSRARRHFYRVLLEIGGNRELQRLYPAIGMHIIYAQYQTRRLRGIRLADYRAIIDAVSLGDAAGAEQAGRTHVDHVRASIPHDAPAG
ncbi:GntR family transcriptional regulator [Novosphingobium lentum]|uniref:GntR family transcriptional regulator n=1 Tax=Novosphingobium lentum TaxID=145287 RepID=UPI000B0E2D3C|nr:GntR family transcriptional regulator [Novosphingobium lentum]